MKVAALDHLGAECVVLRLRAVDPVNGGRFGELGHLLDPAKQVLVLGEREVYCDCRRRFRGGKDGFNELSHGRDTLDLALGCTKVIDD